MSDFFLNEFFLYLALFCICLSFFFWMKSRRRRKKELEWRKSLSKKIRTKFGKKNSGTPEVNF